MPFGKGRSAGSVRRGEEMLEARHTEIINKIDQAAVLYHRLILLVGQPGRGKTATLKMVQDKIAVPIINVNFELSRHMLELTSRQRKTNILKILSNTVSRAPSDVVLLDNMEMLFDVSLEQDPLRLLFTLSRNLTIVAAWSGHIDQGYLIYASPEHSEYRKYPMEDFLVVEL